MNANPSQRKQIRNLLAVLTAAVLAAGGISSWMLYHYNPTGIYYAQNVLLAPELLGKAQTGKKGKLFFEEVEYIYPEGQTEKMRTIPKASYEAFYAQIGQAQNLDPVPDRVLAAFAKGKLPRLVLKIQRNGASETFQEVHFAPGGDYYRVQIGDQGDWAYYHHPGIGNEAQKLFTPEK